MALSESIPTQLKCPKRSQVSSSSISRALILTLRDIDSSPADRKRYSLCLAARAILPTYFLLSIVARTMVPTSRSGQDPFELRRTWLNYTQHFANVLDVYMKNIGCNAIIEECATIMSFCRLARNQVLRKFVD